MKFSSFFLVFSFALMALVADSRPAPEHTRHDVPSRREGVTRNRRGALEQRDALDYEALMELRRRGLLNKFRQWRQDRCIKKCNKLPAAQRPACIVKCQGGQTNVPPQPQAHAQMGLYEQSQTPSAWRPGHRTVLSAVTEESGTHTYE
ncbi:hypothetical protein FISHEDRAFT_54909 [Fistulina hepatica ATCC 64428]|uniref:Uncharacterized protein n=1 Tax=Fistulina hepatica ATCC 64428 TaxID=1128425 RepID=A0A0D7APY9_9AGAR|nr:hypothetical protein FISHEDRAFT_54909 [Fistulina hepatica ATCC 64428]